MKPFRARRFPARGIRAAILSGFAFTLVVGFAQAEPAPTPPTPPAAPAPPAAVAPYQELRQLHESLKQQPTENAQPLDPGWWRSMVVRPLRSDQRPLAISLEDVLVSTLNHSQQVRVFTDLPLIRETAIIEANAAFDWFAFIDTRWDDISEPIGNTLTAGDGISRFQDHNVTAGGGMRRRTHSGGRLEAVQRFGFQDNNSTFFVPDPQGTARLSLNFTQPLLRGRGKVYNTSLTVLAGIDKRVADDELRRQLESHLLEVSRAYWAVYLERGLLYQKTNAYLRGQTVTERLERRQNIDAPVNQIVSAQATLKQRGSELMRARAAVKNAEARLRSLVNNPRYADRELIPTDAPIFEAIHVELPETVTVALQSRPEVLQAMKQIKAACVRLKMSKHELLPVLNLVTETYVAGLEDQGRAFNAWGRQFDTGMPSYSVGLQFEVPVGNRAARARRARRELELRQLRSQYATTLETIRLEVEVAVRELQTSLKELSTKHQAMLARQLHLDAVSKRWERLPGEGVTASLALENMLVAQDRLGQSEYEYLQSQLTYNLAIINLNRATGTLLQQENVSIGRGRACNLPVHVLDKDGPAAVRLGPSPIRVPVDPERLPVP